MRRSLRSLAGLVTVLSLVSVSGAAWGEDAAIDPDVAFTLENARSALIQGDYDEAIQGLLPALDRLRDQAASGLQDVYLLLIKTYVTAGNFHRLRPQGSVTAELHHDRARELTEECLLTEGLSHTRPVPSSDYPDEMIRMFELVRSEKLGSLRIVGLEPQNAMVTLDGRTIKAPGSETLPEVTDLVAGPHDLVIRADGFRERVELLRIMPGSTLEREYALEKRRGVRWWATRVAAASILLGTGAAVVLGGEDGSSPSPLPVAPDPPE
jgi:hypothetical protein